MNSLTGLVVHVTPVWKVVVAADRPVVAAVDCSNLVADFVVAVALDFAVVI